jgi:hypothetical protein
MIKKFIDYDSNGDMATDEPLGNFEFIVTGPGVSKTVRTESGVVSFPLAQGMYRVTGKHPFNKIDR